ncbi:DUF4097 family beta strand repeat-containing protein [Tumebacillus flagellatus]|uniref:DUF4097 domain-containing protein n=1 Tax=Tumebacillus flagellatus TaxID=1157490 RepID=A0A074LQF8_9BACL|nr:DUF4097 family beta strand repeat-containing protein [Tumebacillus flagellatus]KEO82725.1 hypothetical protein EL26_14260 [Tumebacillus flagellatus]
MKRKHTMWVTGLATLLLAASVTGCDANVFKGKMVPISQEKSFDGKNIQSVSIEGHSVDLHLIPTDGDQILLSLKGTLSENAKDSDNEQLLDASVNGSQLVIVTKVPASFMDYKGGDLKLDVQVPKKAYDSLKVEEHSGDVELDAFQAKSFTLDSSSGDSHVHGFQGDSFKLTTHSGNMTLDAMSGKGVVVSHSGDVKLTMSDLKQDLSLESHSGDTALYLPETAAFRLDAVTKSGNKKIGFPFTAQNATDDGEHMTATANNAGDNAPLVKIDSSSGNFEIGKAAH